jgi:hypothetical protein
MMEQNAKLVWMDTDLLPLMELAKLVMEMPLFVILQLMVLKLLLLAMTISSWQLRQPQKRQLVKQELEHIVLIKPLMESVLNVIQL